MSISSIRQAETPLLRNGYALVFNIIGTAGIGALFWLLAARLYTLEDVGVNAALISAMVFLSKLAQLNMGNALNRFVPSAGADTGRFIAVSYAVCALMAGAVATVFVLGLPVWSPDLSMIRTSPLFFVGFVLATIVWTVFVLQDAALTGLRRATWVPVENFAYGLAKVAGLVLLFTIAPGTGIFLAWTVPLVVVLVVVNRLVFTRAVPAHVAITDDSTTRFDAGEVVRYAGADFLGSLGWLVIVDLLPVIVFTLAGAEANAYFFLAWTIAYTLYLIGRATGMSLITEAALDPSRLHVYARRVLGRTLMIVLPIAVGLIALAPQVLGVFGPDYASEGSTVLRLLVLSAIPATAIAVYTAMARVERRLLSMGVMHGTLGFLVTMLSMLWIGPHGIAGVGWACVVSMTAMAAVLLLTQMRMVWLPAALEFGISQSVLSVLERLRSRRIGEHGVLARVAADIATSTGTDCEIMDQLATGPGVRAAVLRAPQGGTQTILKVAGDRAARADLVREAAALDALRTDPGTADWHHLAPRLIHSGVSHNHSFTVQEHLPGLDGRTAAELGLDLDVAMVRAAHAVATLHRQTAARVVVDDAAIERLVETPLRIATTVAKGSLASRHRPAIERLRARLIASMPPTLTITWVHGDLWLGNVLFGAAGEVSGIIDWGGWQPEGLPGLDLAHLVLTTRMMRTGKSLGSVVSSLIDDPSLSDAEKEVMDLVTTGPHEPRPTEQTLFLMAWSHHLASNLTKSDHYGASWLWSTRNIQPVLVNL